MIGWAEDDPAPHLHHDFEPARRGFQHHAHPALKRNVKFPVHQLQPQKQECKALRAWQYLSSKELPLTELPEERMQFTLGMYGEGDFFSMKGVIEEFFDKVGMVIVAAI